VTVVMPNFKSSEARRVVFECGSRGNALSRGPLPSFCAAKKRGHKALTLHTSVAATPHVAGELIRLSACLSCRLCLLSCRLSHHKLHPVGMGIMQSISSEIDSILREEIELAQKDDPALIVRSAFEVIEDFLGQGMSLERIASALQKHDIKITKGHLVRHLGIVREERGLKPLKRGKKPRFPGAAAPAPSASCLQIQPLTPAKAQGDTPYSALAAETDSAPMATELTRNPDEQAKPVTTDTARSGGKHGAAQPIGASQTVFPDEITRLKFIEVKGELLDVTRMNIDDYLTVSKTIPDNAKIPDGMFEIIAAENRIRGMYERALLQYDEAIAKWKSSQ